MCVCVCFFLLLLQPVYGDSVRLLYTDTDSLILQIFTEDLYTDMESHQDLYDTSNFETDHRLYDLTNKKVIGKFKDELGGRIMTEFVGLRPKMYSYTGEVSGKRAKGVSHTVLAKTITHEDYKVRCILMSRTVAACVCVRACVHACVYVSE